MIYKFDDFEFDPRALSLTRGGRSIALKPQAALFLKTLLDAAPRFVTRDELIAALWPDGRVVEFDTGINSCVREARRAMGEAADAARFIETLPRRGYRFAHALAPERPPARAKRAIPLAVAGFAVAALLGVSVFALARPQGAPGLGEAAPAADATLADTLIRARHGLATGSVESLLDARAAFGELAAGRPDLAEARGGYALATALLAGAPERPWRRWTRDAETAARAALAADAGQTDALIALGYIALYRDWSGDQAGAYLDRALAAAPDRANALALRAAVAAAQGDADAAVGYADRAVLADPVAMSVRADRCWYRLFARDADAAIAACEWALELDPAHDYSRLGLVEALRLAGRLDEAAAALVSQPERLAEPSGPVPRIDAAARLRDDACRVAEEWRVLERAQRSAVSLAAFELGCGRAPAALAALRDGLRNRESWMLFLAVDPRFDALRDDEAFRSILAEVTAAVTASG